MFDFALQICSRAFKRAGHLKDHMMTHNPGMSNVPARPTPHKCDICEKSFAKPSQLERHLRIHTGQFICVINMYITAHRSVYMRN